MKRKNKKIVAGMMAGFCVLSTQSVLENFSKLPMRGGNGLISYAMVDDDDDDAVGILDDNNVYDHCQYRLDDINKDELRTVPAPLFEMEKLHIELPEPLLALLGISDYYFSYGDK